MKKSNVLLMSVLFLSTVVSPTMCLAAEETTQSSTVSSTSDPSTTTQSTIMSEAINETSSSETVADQPNVTTETTEKAIQPQTAVIDGQVVQLEPPVKEGQDEANRTQAPKEDLIEVAPRASRAAASPIQLFRLYNPNSGEHFYTKTTSERDHLRKVGWRYEGIAWHAVGNGSQSHEDYRLLGVKNYNQYALGAPSGCEGASLLQALQYKGKLSGWSLRSFLNTIPKSNNGNPNNGFVGSPFVENSWTYSAIYPAPLTTWGKKYGNVQNISGSSMNTLINEVKNGNPVVAWVTINFQPIRWGNWSFGVAANNNHAVTLDGFNKAGNQVHVSDPISGSYWLSRTTFENIYNARKYAVVVK